MFEFKVIELRPEGQAIEQIKAKGYADKYRALGQSIHLIGAEFSSDSRNICRLRGGACLIVPSLAQALRSGHLAYP